MLEPVRNLVLIEKKIDESPIILLNNQKDESAKFVIKALGRECVHMKAEDIGREVFILPHALVAQSNRKEYEAFGLVPETDIWAFVNPDKTA